MLLLPMGPNDAARTAVVVEAMRLSSRLFRLIAAVAAYLFLLAW
jgi:hypothetical protein